ncbi:Maf family protein [Lutimaribacter sp. EGI FJ00015]|uniref:Maf family protein n=1 Tax=Lutimaribacter degradans TaxID=2945989 RepID=A0ACC5ZUK8_9RHOB|nr:Maf family protein [Lutimaribacter sp. EGI FJ00013]MCM2561977.1 Maf family protein [Lutimaribacter sp. EGI FJ00013]MCO0612991.1 Maf family protein [Lutimaribacter sp. EGI FJ00015]MCO0635809.1 Maf family protein [Lutimaribacter sp. EGI FJ00014]
MGQNMILASGSTIRRKLLERAGVEFDVQTARVDEDMVRDALLAENASARDIADALAELKARKVSHRNPGALVLGCDQVLSFEHQLLSKPRSRDAARDQLQALRGKRHQLLSAGVICEDGQPIWRFVGTVRLMMRDFSDDYLDAYLDRNWPDISESVGAYKLEEEGVRLFSRVEGDYFTVLGMPLLEILNYLTLRGDLQK